MKWSMTVMIDLTEINMPTIEVFHRGIFINLGIISISIVDLGVLDKFIQQREILIEYEK